MPIDSRPQRDPQPHPPRPQSQQVQQQQQQSSAPGASVDCGAFLAGWANETKRYTVLNLIGKGSYGVVCAARDNLTNEMVAIKKIQNVFDNVADAHRILREVTLLRLLKHPDIVDIKHIMLPADPATFKDLYVVFELMESDLHTVIGANDDLTRDHHKVFLYQLLRGLNFMHTNGVLHRDLKPKNILANSNCKLKICDFGLARPYATGDGQQAPLTPVLWTDYVATRWYRAPELCGCFYGRYNSAVDTWSTGCIFAEVLLGKPLFPGRDAVSQLQLITDLLGKPPPHVIEAIGNVRARKFLAALPPKDPRPLAAKFPDADPLALDLLARMLSFDPADRPTAAEALGHAYFSGLPSAVRQELVPVAANFEFEHSRLTEVDVRHLIYREVLHYHPHVMAAYERQLAACRTAAGGPLPNPYTGLTASPPVESVALQFMMQACDENGQGGGRAAMQEADAAAAAGMLLQQQGQAQPLQQQQYALQPQQQQMAPQHLQPYPPMQQQSYQQQQTQQQQPLRYTPQQAQPQYSQYPQQPQLQPLHAQQQQPPSRSNSMRGYAAAPGPALPYPSSTSTITGALPPHPQLQQQQLLHPGPLHPAQPSMAASLSGGLLPLQQQQLQQQQQMPGIAFGDMAAASNRTASGQASLYRQASQQRLQLPGQAPAQPQQGLSYPAQYHSQQAQMQQQHMQQQHVSYGSAAQLSQQVMMSQQASYMQYGHAANGSHMLGLSPRAPTPGSSSPMYAAHHLHDPSGLGHAY